MAHRVGTATHKAAHTSRYPRIHTNKTKRALSQNHADQSPKTESGKAFFNTSPQPTQPDPPNYMEDGKFSYNNHIYKVSLYSGNITIDEKDVAPDKIKAWQATAKKVVEALAHADLLPGAGTFNQTEAVDVNFTTQKIKQKKNGALDFEKKVLPIPPQGNALAGEIAGEISEHAVNLKTYQEKCQADKKADESIRSMFKGTFSQYTYERQASATSPVIPKGKGKNACTSISVKAALAMAKNQDRIKSDQIDTLLEEGITLHTKTNLDLRPPPDEPRSLTPIEILGNNKNLFENNGSIDDIEHALSTNITMKPAEGSPEIEEDKVKEHFKNKFHEFVAQIVQKTEDQSENPKILGGVITMQGSSYAFSVKISGSNYRIEFFDSHGMAKSDNKAYTVEFSGNKDDAINKFVEFFTTTHRHTYYRFSAEEQGLRKCVELDLKNSQKPSSAEDITQKINEMKFYNQEINQMTFTEIKPKKVSSSQPGSEVSGTVNVGRPANVNVPTEIDQPAPLFTPVPADSFNPTGSPL